ncbi:MAG: vitamin K epoxide reductase family protein [Sphingomonadaceae bacterium]
MKVKATRRGWAIPALAALGLGDAAYLSALHFQGEIPPCGGYAGCATVNTSPYAEIFGVPVAALGAALYLLLFVIGLWRLRVDGDRMVWSTLLLYSLVVAGALFMAYLTAVEFFVLHAYCYWCLALAGITLLLLILVTTEIWALGTRGAASYPRRA